MHLPTFFILGAAKAGTTSLYYYLSQHPGVCMAHPKEPLFFWGHEYEYGEKYYRDRYFRHHRGEPITGDAAHRNLFMPLAAARIARATADPKFIIALREPVARAFSHYCYALARKEEKRTFEEAIAANAARLRNGPRFLTQSEADLYSKARMRQREDLLYPSYLDSGHYAEQIKRYVDLFGWDRIKLVWFEDLAADPQRIANDLQQFLGLSPIELEDAGARNPNAASFVYRLYKLIGAVPGVDRIPAKRRQAVKHALARRFRGVKPDLLPATTQMLRRHYAPHNLELSRITGRDLNHWSTSADSGV